MYGSLQDPAVQAHLIGRTLDAEPAVLPGYRSHTDETYPVALPEDGASVDGQLLRVTPEELTILDEYEGDAYERVRATLKNGTEVHVYQGKSTDE